MSEHPVKRKKRYLWWIEWGLYLIAVVCAVTYGVRWYRFRAANRPSNVLAQLEPNDRIPLDRGSCAGSNVVLITMDTTRADHLGCYGYADIKTPVIDSLAKQGVLFAKAYTPSPSTLPGHSSIMTGLNPYNHGARANGTFHANAECTTLAEILKQDGYATGTVISAYVLDGRFGLNQGFDVYNDDLSKGFKYSRHSFRERPAPYTNEAALEWVDTVMDDKFFLWVHYFDPHAPYIPPEPFFTEYGEQLYDGEIAHLDWQIGQLMVGLKERGVLDNTIIVLAADHGEGLGEHGEQTHSLLVYDSTLHTPLIFVPPGEQLGQVVDRQVSNIDIVPTILDMLGIDAAAPFDGASLVRGPDQHPDNIYAETIATLVLHGWSPLFAVRRQDEKYIHAPTAELYDLQADPKELKNLFKARPDVSAALSRRLDEHIGEDRFGASALAQMVNMDRETARKLAALGYVGTVTDDGVDAEQASRLDPKDMVPHFDRVQNAEQLMLTGKYREGIEELQECLEEVPDDVWAMRILASAYLEKDDIDRAEEFALRALELEKNEPALYQQLASVSLGRGRPREAEAHLRKALEVDPEFAPAYVTLGAMYARLAGPEKALEYFNRAIEMDPGTTGPAAYNAIGTMHAARTEFDEAREAYNKSLELDPLNAGAETGLAMVLIEEDKLEEAEEKLKKAARYMPNDLRVISTLAALHNERGQYEDGILRARQALEVNENHLQALNSLGSALRNTGDLAGAEEAFEKILSKEPKYVPALINLGQVYLAQNREEKAVELYERALEVNPNQPIALFNIGTYKTTRGRRTEAVDYYRRAVAADPDYAIAHQHLGMLLLTQGQGPAALTHLERSLELDPNQAERERTNAVVEKLRATIQAQKSAADDGTEPAAS